ncbi:response regulator [Tumidithrix elongata RA019]|uniref:Circadian input-output histidine kinase CikA n=1 Tax=Tumidithrix elongata BACA0141 TaxID=2716417 RepID=A0AAW9PXI6_9CYAN|nr:response regulator [Tumidithrix elongata RA019]
MKQSSLLKKLLVPPQRSYLVVNRNLVIVEESYGVQRFAGLIIKVAIGQDVRLCFPELIGLERILDEIWQGERSGFELKSINRAQVKGEPIYFDIYILSAFDTEENQTILIWFEDVSEKMNMTQKLVHRANEAELLSHTLATTNDYIDKIIGSMADALLVTTTTGKIKTFNQAAQELFGYSREELQDLAIAQLILDTKFLERVHQQQALTDKHFLESTETICQTKDSTDILVSFSCSIIKTDQEGIFNYVYVGRDITELKRTENELNLARQQAEQSAQAKGIFLANMSHEIRTPMNGVLGMTDLLLETTLTSEQRDYVESIRMSGDFLLSLINEILDFSKLEAGEMQLEVIDFNLIKCVEDVMELLAPQAHKKGLEINTLIERQVPIYLRGDVGRLRQILTNLVSNAIKFTAQGEVILSIEVSNADLPLARESDRGEGQESGCELLFSVTDTGIGIAKQHQNKLFTSFSQVDPSTTRKYGGTGLGLAISKQLVTLMSGRIGLESPILNDRGSQFWFKVPFLLQPAKGEGRHDTKTEQFKGRSLLLIDQNANSRRAIFEQLTQLGIAVQATDSATSAWELLLKTDGSDRLTSQLGYDGILIDFKMEPTDGIALSRQILSIPILANLPLILMIHTNQRHLVSEALNAGFNGYLVKPLKFSRLMQAIADAWEIPLDSTIPESLYAQSRKTSSLLPQDRNASDLRILIAEDNLVNQKVALKHLEQMGYVTEVVNNGVEVLEVMKIRTFDIVFMDCQMPLLDGYATTHEIRRWENANPTQHRTVIIAMTANALKEDCDRCLAAGMDDYLSKPLRRELLQSKLSDWATRIQPRTQATIADR